MKDFPYTNADHLATKESENEISIPFNNYYTPHFPEYNGLSSNMQIGLKIKII